ncbi:hypothetical protein QFZ77_006315 [Paenibacillus sp. V4I3]|nr:hypothetical protein [Paenibacillus sp. V4I3]MDQ0886472.1 hypothetical protein [Paenibacillus sp. V4I9]
MIQMSIIGRWKELIEKDKKEFRECRMGHNCKPSSIT